MLCEGEGISHDLPQEVINVITDMGVGGQGDALDSSSPGQSPDSPVGDGARLDLLEGVAHGVFCFFQLPWYSYLCLPYFDYKIYLAMLL